jgi:BirA family biotin operon repressor/biotin-[acetyl-CoA-carboxylase] ligase
MKALLETRAIGRVLEKHASIGSTNDRARELARRGAAHGLAVMADSQTRGRGQRGKTWSSPPGRGLYVSYLVRPSLHTRSAPVLTLIAGLSLLDAVRKLWSLEAALKWPNDLLAREGRKKIAGVLVELSADQLRIDHAVIGIGVNLKDRAWPAELDDYATSVEEVAGRSVERDPLYAAIAKELEAKLDEAESQGVAGIVERVEVNLLGRGEVAELDVDGTKTRGVLAGLAEDGALVLSVEGREQTFHRGELQLPNAPIKPR